MESAPLFLLQYIQTRQKISKKAFHHLIFQPRGYRDSTCLHRHQKKIVRAQVKSVRKSAKEFKKVYSEVNVF